MKKYMFLIISVLFFSCTTKKVITKNNNKPEIELDSLLKTRFTDNKIRNDVYNDIIDAFYVKPNSVDSTLVFYKN